MNLFTALVVIVACFLLVVIAQYLFFAALAVVWACAKAGMSVVRRVLEFIEHPPVEHLDRTAQAVIASFCYVVGYGLLFLIGGLIISIVPIWIWLALGLPG